MEQKQSYHSSLEDVRTLLSTGQCPTHLDNRKRKSLRKYAKNFRVEDEHQRPAAARHQPVTSEQHSAVSSHQSLTPEQDVAEQQLASKEPETAFYTVGQFVLVKLTMGRRHATFVAEIMFNSNKFQLQYMEEENGPEVYKPPADNIMQSPDIREVSLVTFPDPISQQGQMDREAPRELITNCRRKALPLEERVKVIKMYAAGRSCRRIAREFNVGKTQITNIVKIKDSILKDFQSGHPQTRKRKNRGTTTQDEMNSFPLDSKQHEMR
ncbi:UNVERIFIED_CONTAM: hypothetical protein FKN15_049812 [Acipenser sinensis]